MNWFYFLSPFILQAIIWVPTRLFFKFFFHVKTEGLENIEGLKNGVIFAQNHTSELDVFPVPSSLPFVSHLMPTFYTSREQSYYRHSGWRQRFYGGFFFKLWGSHRVLVGVRNYEKALETHLEILRQGGSLCIFPEAVRSKDGKLGPAKGGMAYLAHKANVPIVPVGVTGLLNPSWKSVLSRERRAIFRFGKPIYPTELFRGLGNPNPSGYKIAAQRVVDEIASLLSKETYRL